MAASNHRIKDYETVHHLISRIAHRVYFMKKDERNDFLDLVVRAAQFSGLTLIGWCIMTNHFHLLVYLPAPVELSDEEVVERYGKLKGDGACRLLQEEIARLRAQGEAGEELIRKRLDGLRKRMYRIDEFMKIIKQSFTEDYNRRHAHSGTMWESVYRDIPVPMKFKNLQSELCYQHLNPIRAAITPDFDSYAWSSLTAFVRGNSPLAEAGMRFVYGKDLSRDEMLSLHHVRLEALLGETKRLRALEIARKRSAGYEIACDALTSEAEVAQAAAHLKRVQDALVALQGERLLAQGQKERRQNAERMMLAAVELDPMISLAALAGQLALPHSSVHNQMKKMEKDGRVRKNPVDGSWIVVGEKNFC